MIIVINNTNCKTTIKLQYNKVLFQMFAYLQYKSLQYTIFLVLQFYYSCADRLRKDDALCATRMFFFGVKIGVVTVAQYQNCQKSIDFNFNNMLGKYIL